MRVEIPADVLLCQEVWQLSTLGGRNLVAAVAQFWSDERQVQRGIDVGFEHELRRSGAHTRHCRIRKTESETLGACPELIDMGPRSCVPHERGAGLFGRGEMEGDIPPRGLHGDTGGPRGCDLGYERQTGESPEHVPDARYGCDAEQRHIADIRSEAAETAHRRDRLHADAGPPGLADHGRSEQVSPAEGGAVSQ